MSNVTLLVKLRGFSIEGLGVVEVAGRRGAVLERPELYDVSRTGESLDCPQELAAQAAPLSQMPAGTCSA